MDDLIQAFATFATGAVEPLFTRIAALTAERDDYRSAIEVLARLVNMLAMERDEAQAEASLCNRARTETRLYRELLVWIEREAAMYSESGRAEINSRIRALTQHHVV